MTIREKSIKCVMTEQMDGFKDFLKTYDTDYLFDNLSRLSATQIILEELQHRCISKVKDYSIIKTVYEYHTKKQDYIFYVILELLSVEENQDLTIDEFIVTLIKELKHICYFANC